ncbi:hypothetical protein SLT36_02270 [Aminobacter sp. BA135]|uniref:hypothetical protein n=1 Tax=Aminobacter sp. BA135 TaxID=537596 RepID=UPI003D7A60E2
MVDSDRIDKLIAAVPPALAFRTGLDLGIFTRLGGSAASAHSLGAALNIAPDRLSRLLYVVIFSNADTTTVLRTGVTAAAVTHDYAAGDAVLEPSGFRPQA